MNQHTPQLLITGKVKKLLCYIFSNIQPELQAKNIREAPLQLIQSLWKVQVTLLQK